jgi:NAD(P)-dependent dehydrogenase (short-subunit alcohol dehydrogenase family)
VTENLRLPQQVVVTGGSGKLGRAVVADLLQHGWAVINVDQTPPPKDQGCPHVRVDLTDFGQAVEALTTIPEDGVDRRGPSRGDSSTGYYVECRDVREQRALDLQPVRRRPARWYSQRRLGIE